MISPNAIKAMLELSQVASG